MTEDIIPGDFQQCQQCRTRWLWSPLRPTLLSVLHQSLQHHKHSIHSYHKIHTWCLELFYLSIWLVFHWFVFWLHSNVPCPRAFLTTNDLKEEDLFPPVTPPTGCPLVGNSIMCGALQYLNISINPTILLKQQTVPSHITVSKQYVFSTLYAVCT